MKKSVIFCLCILALMSACATTGSQTPPSAFTAFVSLDEALAEATANLASQLRENTIVIIAGIEAPFYELSDFISFELASHLVTGGKFTVLERGAALESVDAEHQFQMSGLVSDESAVGIGHYFSAQAVVTGTFLQFEGFNQLRLRVIDVRSSQLLALYRTRIRPDDAVLAAITRTREDLVAQTITENALTHLNRGEDFLREGRANDGLQELNSALDIHDGLVDAYSWRGNMYINIGDLDQAIEEFSTALEISPSSERVLNNRGVAFSEKGDLDQAIEDFTTALTISPNNQNLLINRGHAYVEKGVYDQATIDFAAAEMIRNKLFQRDSRLNELSVETLPDAATNNWQNKWTYFRISLDYPTKFKDEKYFWYYPDYPNSSEGSVPLVSPRLAVSLGYEIQYLNWMSTEFDFILNIKKPLNNTTLSTVQIEQKFPLKPSAYFMIEPYVTISIPVDTSPEFNYFPVYALGGGIQFGAKAGNSSALFLDLWYLHSLGDVISKNKVYPNPYLFGIGFGYKIGFFNRIKK